MRKLGRMLRRFSIPWQLKILMKDGWLMLQKDIAKIGLSTSPSLKGFTLSMVMIKLEALIACLIFYPVLFLLVLIALSAMTILMTPVIVMNFIIRRSKEYLLTWNTSTK